MLRRLIRFTSLGLLLAIVIIGSLLVISPFLVYDVFNQEFPIARLEFTRAGDNAWTAWLSRGDFCTREEYALRGDQFQIDAGFVKWKGLAVLMGFRPLYRLDRLSGRYRDVQAQNTQTGLAHDLTPDMLFDFFDENTQESKDGWLIDTTYGSSVYYAIDPLLRYTVYSTEDGLILRTSGILYVNSNNGLVIEINEGCSDATDGVLSLILKLNNLLGALLKDNVLVGKNAPPALSSSAKLS